MGKQKPTFFRLNSNGSIDNSFVSGVGFDLGILAIVPQPDGKVLAGGVFTTYKGISTNRVVRLNSNESIDATFSTGTGFNSIVPTITLLSDGKILVGGYRFMSYDGAINPLTRLSGSSTLSIAKFDKNGLVIYPNPVKDILNINLPVQDSALEYMIYDVSGKK